MAIYSNLAKRKSFKELHKELYNLTINSKVDKITRNNLYKISNIIAKKLHKKVEDNLGLFDIALASFVFKEIKKTDFNRITSKAIYTQARNIESEEKAKVIDDVINDSREEEDTGRLVDNDTGETHDFENEPIVFYLTSEHLDSALDHKEYQGKIYIDEKWERLITDDFLKEMIKEFIKKNGTKTFQWVIGRPVWFITRPNCRHWFRQITIEQAFGESIEKMLKDYDMFSPIGHRRWVQTIPHSTRKSWYKIENVKNIIEQYKERLKTHQAMYEQAPCEELKGAINKDKLLITKWTDYLDKM